MLYTELSGKNCLDPIKVIGVVLVSPRIEITSEILKRNIKG